MIYIILYLYVVGAYVIWHLFFEGEYDYVLWRALLVVAAWPLFPVGMIILLLFFKKKR